MSNRHDYYSIVKWEFHLSSSGIGFGLGFLVGLHLTKFSIKDFVNLILFKIVEIPNVVININKQWLLRIITRILSKSYSSITKYTDTLLRGGRTQKCLKGCFRWTWCLEKAKNYDSGDLIFYSIFCSLL